MRAEQFADGAAVILEPAVPGALPVCVGVHPGGDGSADECGGDGEREEVQDAAEGAGCGEAECGEDGEDAAWLIAQHSDQDPEFQARAVELLREAVEAGQASPGNLAYLEDRVLVGKGEPQVYGTQIRCGADGPEPATPISEEATLDERRIAAGLQPLSVYYEELAEICAAEG